ncbi:MAG TPA: hypothetical protein VE911_00385 [Candidatus Nitrosopolaris sp.]|nr:hypothetical protein [Candidatus Nitrosopolaris sp.]
MSGRLVLGIAILLAQIGSVIYVHFGPAPGGQPWLRKTLDGCSAEPVDCRRYLAWAPNDYLVQYEVSAEVRGQVLSPLDAYRRYHFQPSGHLGTGIFQDPPQRIIDTVEAYERGHDPDDRDRVVVTYTVNGGPRHEWRWPHE